MGVWLRRRREPAAGVESAEPQLLAVPRKPFGRRGNVWRARRSLQLRMEADLAISGADGRIQHSKRSLGGFRPEFRTERQQRRRAVALQGLIRNSTDRQLLP